MKTLNRIGLALLFLTQLSLSSFAQSAGVISTVAGSGTRGYGGDGGPATSASVNNPMGIAADSAGNLYIADTANNRIRKVTPAGVISTVAGNGTPGFSGDGGPAISAQLHDPSGVAVDSVGNLYIADTTHARIRKVTPEGVISTVAGNGGIWGASGDGGPATSAALMFTVDVAVDRVRNFYFSETSGYGGPPDRVRRVTPEGVISTVWSDQGLGIEGVAVDSAGSLYIADNGSKCVRKVTPDGTISTVAGNGTMGYSGDGGPATSAQLNGVWDVAVDSAGNLYIADLGRIRKVTPDGMISTVAGNGTSGYGGDGGPATSAQLNGPLGIAVDSTGSLYISDSGNDRIRKVETPAAVTTYFPQIAVGDGWSTLFTVTNTGSTEASGNLVLTDQQGNPLTVNGQLTDSFGTTQLAHPGSSFTLTIPSGGTVFLSAGALSPGDAAKAGWGQLESTAGSLTAIATYEYAVGASTQCMVGVLQSQPLQYATIPVDNDNSLGKQMAYAIANPGSQTSSVKLALVGQDGTVVDDTVIVTLGPGQQVARYLWQDEPRLKFRGSLVLRGQNGRTFVAVGLLEKQGSFTVIPLIPVKAPGVPD